MPRRDGRAFDELRPIRLTRGWAKYAEGSCLTEFGDTKVLCTASVDNTVPPWLRGGGRGWVTAEYGMLPRSTGTRHPRDSSRPKPDGRTIEIQRLIGRSLRAAIDLHALGERSVMLDCDVLQADGGTRTAAITGAWVALCEALARLRAEGQLRGMPLGLQVTAISAGIVERQALLDLAYAEDSRASVNMNVVMAEGGRLIEVQAGGEGQPFSRDEMAQMLELAERGIAQLALIQRETVKDIW